MINSNDLPQQIDSNTKKNDWLVIGAGAIGLLWYSKLHQSNYTPTLLYRGNDLVNALNVIEEDSNINTFPLKKIKLENISDNKRLFNRALFCTKSFDLVNAYHGSNHLLTQDAHILCLCNGMGIQQQLASVLRKEQKLFVGTTSEGVLKTDQNTIQKMGKGDTYFGSLSNKKRDVFPPTPFHQFYAPDIQEKLLSKLAINAAINPLTALFHVNNGRLLSTPYQRLLEACCAEIDTVIEKTYLTNHSCKNMVKKVALATQNNKSSMLQDVTHGRQTEILDISGHLLNIAKSIRLDLPIQNILLKALTGKINKEKAKKWLLDNY